MIDLQALTRRKSEGSDPSTSFAGSVTFAHTMGSLATTASSLDMEILEENLDGHKTSMTSLDPFENSCYEKNVSKLSKVYSGSRPDLEEGQ